MIRLNVSEAIAFVDLLIIELLSVMMCDFEILCDREKLTPENMAAAKPTLYLSEAVALVFVNSARRGSFGP